MFKVPESLTDYIYNTASHRAKQSSAPQVISKVIMLLIDVSTYKPERFPAEFEKDRCGLCSL